MTDEIRLKQWLLDNVSLGFTVAQLSKVQNGPSIPLVLSWLRDDSAFYKGYEEALEIRQSLLHDMLFEAAKVLMDVNRELPKSYIPKVKLASEIIFKLGPVIAPNRFGSKVSLEHSMRGNESLNMVVEIVKPENPDYTAPKVIRT